MNKTMTENLPRQARLLFWRAATRATALALRHKRGLYKALTVAPIAIVAMAAFILGRGVGLLIGTGLF